MDDPSAVLAEAVSLMQQGEYEQSLQKHLWFHDHALEHNPALAGVRLSFALGYWTELGELYPPARQELLAVRDRKAKAVADGQGSFGLFFDVAAINSYLHEQPQTVALFRLLHGSYPDLARQCYQVAEADLVAHREYETCLCYVPDPLARFEAIRQSHQMKLEIAGENAALDSAEFRSYVELSFASEACRLIEILAGAGRGQDAERVRELALAVGAGDEARAALNAALPPPESGNGAADGLR
jgi:hypothetical protein